MRCDGVVATQPPVSRAIELVVAAIEKLGYQVIDWNPSSHKRGVELVVIFCKYLVVDQDFADTTPQYDIWKLDGGRDIHGAFSLSEETPADQISGNYGAAPFEEKTATEIAKINVEKRTYQKEYMDYWNSTSALTKTGKPVDAFIMPLAPFVAAIPGKYEYHGMPPCR